MWAAAAAIMDLEHLFQQLRGPFSFLRPGPSELGSLARDYAIALPEPQRVFLAREEATPILGYVGGTSGTAGVQYDGAYRLVLLGFPFESIDSGEDRARVMRAVLDFLLAR